MCSITGSARCRPRPLPNRSFWTAATSSGFSVNAPVKNFVLENQAETIFNRLDDHGKTWKIYVAEPQRLSGTALAHLQRLKDKAATHIVPFSEFETDAASGNLPDFAFIEPCLTLGHGDYHPACGRAMRARRRDPQLRPAVIDPWR